MPRKKASKKSPRRRIDLSDEPVADIYNLKERKVKFIPSGCTLLDCVLGGGWAEGRYANIVGDSSAGKTLLAIEAAAQFRRKYGKKGRVYYAESEAAFDEDYAESLGMDVDGIDFPEVDSVEDVHEDIERILAKQDASVPKLYVIDSMDSLTDRAEQKRSIDEGTYGMTKQKVIGQMLRRLIRPIRDGNMTLFIVSQVRENIGVTFGEKLRRSGGKALDFYASQIVWLSKLGTKKRTVQGVERAVYIDVRAKAKKNKVGPPFREVDFPIYFGYGIDDLQASLEFLIKVKMTKLVGLEESKAKTLLSRIWKMLPADYDPQCADAREAVKEAWEKIESGFEIPRKKYR